MDAREPIIIHNMHGGIGGCECSPIAPEDKAMRIYCLALVGGLHPRQSQDIGTQGYDLNVGSNLKFHSFLPLPSIAKHINYKLT